MYITFILVLVFPVESSGETGRPCNYYLGGDFNFDCRVDLYDLAYLAGVWLVDCNEAPRHSACVVLDYDEDGYPFLVDCDDDNPDINPAALEIIDQIDNDCDGLIDENDSGEIFCDPGWGNCDDDPLNGCETALNTNVNCGDCGQICDLDVFHANESVPPANA